MPGSAALSATQALLRISGVTTEEAEGITAAGAASEAQLTGTALLARHGLVFTPSEHQTLS